MSTDPLPSGLTFVHGTDMTLGQQIGRIMFTGDLDWNGTFQAPTARNNRLRDKPVSVDTPSRFARRRSDSR